MSVSPNSLPLRLSPKITTALEVAILVKACSSYTDAAALIEQYAQTEAAAAALQATIDTSDKMLAAVRA